MKLLAVLAASWGLAALPLQAGSIVGTIQGHGPAPAETGGAGGGYSSMRYKFAERVDYDHLQDFVVSIDQPVPGAAVPVKAQQMAQHYVAFDPHVLAIPVGTRVDWPNLDEIYHNVFSMSDTDEFNLGLRTNKEQAQTYVFSTVGRIDVFCSIHSKMHGIILVLPSPYFAKVNARQHYRIDNVPAGTYRLRAWHERLPPRHETVTVPATGDVTVNFDLGVSDLPKR
jgi:plastocyanin